MLTPETALRLHLTQARELWRADRLDLADAAMRAALRVGFAPGATYDLQRTIEAELGARRSAQVYRVTEELIIEADVRRWGGYWPVIHGELHQAMRHVTGVLQVRWPKPVMVTLIPSDDWVEFMHARYGYYAARTDRHKVCLPPVAMQPSGLLSRAARHEIAHAAAHQLAGDGIPRWLDEGVAVTLEGGSPQHEIVRLHQYLGAGKRLTLQQVSVGFESYDQEIGSPRSHLCYAAAGAFVGALARQYGVEALRVLLVRLGGGEAIDRAYRKVYGQALSRAEQEWWQRLTR